MPLSLRSYFAPSGPKKRGWLARFGLAGGAMLLLGAGSVMAHPHVWVTQRSEVVIENGAIVAIRHAWTFDQYYSATAIDGLDTNKDGVYSREELAELAKVNVQALKDFSYFTVPRLAGKDLALGEPRDYWLEHNPKPEPAASAKPPAVASPGSEAAANPASPPQSGADRIQSAAEKAAPGVLTLHFTLPLAQPVLVEAPAFSFGVGDPSFFIAFEPADGTPVTLAAGAPTGCRIASTEEKTADKAGDKAAKSDAPSQPGTLMTPQAAPAISFTAATEWTVVCKPQG